MNNDVGRPKDPFDSVYWCHYNPFKGGQQCSKWVSKKSKNWRAMMKAWEFKRNYLVTDLWSIKMMFSESLVILGLYLLEFLKIGL